MFAQSVATHLKHNRAGEFISLFENEAIPILRQQEGFQHAITFITPDGKDVVTISLWSNKKLAEAYQQHAYAGILDVLAKVFDGNPQVKTYEVCNSTIPVIAPADMAAAVHG